MQVHTYKDADEVCNALADWMAALMDKTLQAKEKFVLALSGGETPKKLYKILAASPYNEKIKWDRVHFFWGDERVVPFDDERNNAKMAFDNLLDKVKIPSGNIHRIWTDVEPAVAAAQYEKILHQYFDDKQTTFDLVLLGLGEDGHTLSLFPGSEVLPGKTGWVNAVHSAEKGERITLMPDVVNRSASVAFLVTGESKSAIVEKLFSDQHIGEFPAQLVKPVNNELHWFLDKTASSGLNPEKID